MDLKPISACLTGHRDIPTSAYEAIASALLSCIDTLYRQGIRRFYCGGALGFDTVAAVTLLNCRPHYPDLKLILALPCPEQSARWPAPSRALYQSILSRADEVLTLSPAYTPHCMLARDRYMVDHSAYCIAYLQKESGGTAYTVNYAHKKGLTVIHLAEKG